MRNISVNSCRKLQFVFEKYQRDEEYFLVQFLRICQRNFIFSYEPFCRDELGFRSFSSGK